MANGSSSSAINKGAFFGIGEIRPPTDADFDFFLTLTDNYDGWTVKHNKSDTVVWVKEIEGSLTKIFKVLIHFVGLDADSLFDTLQDNEYRHVWDEAVIEDTTICRLEGINSDICYYSMKCPKPLRNRDFIGQRCWRYSESEYIVFNHSVAHEKYPPSRQFIRGISYITGFIVRKTELGCSLCYVTHSDPKGKVPKWMLNVVASKIAPRVASKVGEAARKYSKWKDHNKPNYKPWLNEGQNDTPIVSLSSLQSLSSGEVPLSPGIPNEEGELEDGEHIPSEFTLDPILLVNGHH